MTETVATLKKGMTVRLRWWGRAKLVALAGAQMKAELGINEKVGVVLGVYGDDPIDPTPASRHIRFQPRDGGDVVEIYRSAILSAFEVEAP